MTHTKEEKEPWKLGIKLQFLISWSKQEGILSLTTEDVCEKFIKPTTQQKQLSYCQQLLLSEDTAGFVGSPTAYISHIWRSEFLEVVEALTSYFAFEEDVIIWFDIFSINQHTSFSFEFSFEFELWTDMFKNLIHSTGRTVMVLAPWNDLLHLRRAWVIWDMFCTIEGKCELDFAMSPDSMEMFIAEVDTDPQNAINKMLATIDTSKSESSKAEDGAKIHDAIQETIGFKELNEEIFKLMRGWMITIYEARIKAASEIDMAKLLSSMNSLATLFMSQGEYEKALSLYEECLTRRKVFLGDYHPDTLSSMKSLASFLLTQEFYEDHHPMSSHIYYVPSLFPSISTINEGEIYFDSETGIGASKINKERNFKAKSDAIHEMPDDSWSIGTHFSLFFYPRMEGFAMQKSQCLVYDVISSSELEASGFLPPGSFEQFSSLFKERVVGFRPSEMIDGVGRKVSLTYAFLNICIKESREEKRIEVIIRSHPNADKVIARKVFQDIYYIMIDVIDVMRTDSNMGWLQVKTLIHPPLKETDSCAFICQGNDVAGYITLTKVRQLLQIPQGSVEYEQYSCDSRFKIELNLELIKEDPYWSVWEGKLSINPSPTAEPSAAPPLRKGKKTHVFLSHDWGIDCNNHHRVKQISDALKSRGLITWFDDDWIVNDIYEPIVDGIDNTDCMIVFITKNYASKVNGGNDNDFCKRELLYGFERGVKFLPVVLESNMRNPEMWGGLLNLKLGNIMSYDLSPIFEPSSSLSSLSETSLNHVFNGLYEEILDILNSERSDFILLSPETMQLSKTLKSEVWTNDEKSFRDFSGNDIASLYHPETLLIFLRESSFSKPEGIKDRVYYKSEFNRSVKLVGRRNPSFKNVENFMEQNILEKERKIKARELLTFLNGMGMLMWIEEKDLEDVIILDPIEYLVEPVTSIMSDHRITNDDSLNTTSRFHGESSKNIITGWTRMKEYGIVSEELAKDILKAYFLQIYDPSSVSMRKYQNVVQLIISLGLMAASFPPFTSFQTTSGNSDKNNHNNTYFITSLTPTGSQSFNEGSFEGGGSFENNLQQDVYMQLLQRQKTIEESWNVGMHYSLFIFLPINLLPIPTISDLISCSELLAQGVLPQHFFQFFVDRFSLRVAGFLSKTIAANIAELSYRHINIRFLENPVEKRIEVIIRSHPNADAVKAKKVFQDIYYIMVDVVEALLRECNEGLQVKTLIHLPPTASSAFTGIRMYENGFFALGKVRELLSSSDEGTKAFNSRDNKCEISLTIREMKKDPYWSVWKEEVKVSTVRINSTRLPLRAGKQTHVFLSHDWGIDGNNHRRVKQISDALKSRGLITWIDDERINNDIDGKIIDGIDHTECMIVFLTENYVSKVDGSNDKDYCKREFNYGFEVLGKENVVLVVLDTVMKERKKWGGTIRFHLGSVLSFDLTMIFQDSSSSSDRINEINKLFERITGLKPFQHRKPMLSLPFILIMLVILFTSFVLFTSRYFSIVQEAPHEEM